ncbi:hypothetical protein M5K25_005015 [Dendrobium thyrsiflorum]|uniref:Reverse transcriptase zinc-binding domain-containing protein n=1 Tax=Dendrobium thyrsiflorum TaxID=117978 RepID=A0ABD0VGE7_DENTH
MVAWVNVCKPKSKGGLGLHSIPALIYGFNCALILRFSNLDYPLAAWITAKYGNPWQSPSRLVSPLWKTICTTAEEAKVNFSFVDNAVKWKGLNKYNFSNFMEGFYYSFADCQWANSVWHRKSVLRYSVFGWLALVGGLKTAVELSRRNIQVDLECVFCHNAPESISHLFFYCNFSHSILCNLIPAASSILLRPNIHQLFDWIAECPTYNEQTKCFYYLITCCVIYSVWRERWGSFVLNCGCSVIVLLGCVGLEGISVHLHLLAVVGCSLGLGNLCFGITGWNALLSSLKTFVYNRIHVAAALVGCSLGPGFWLCGLECFCSVS